jgi:hypothetical protein
MTEQVDGKNQDDCSAELTNNEHEDQVPHAITLEQIEALDKKTRKFRGDKKGLARALEHEQTGAVPMEPSPQNLQFAESLLRLDCTYEDDSWLEGFDDDDCWTEEFNNSKPKGKFADFEQKSACGGNRVAPTTSSENVGAKTSNKYIALAASTLLIGLVASFGFYSIEGSKTHKPTTNLILSQKPNLKKHHVSSYDSDPTIDSKHSSAPLPEGRIEPHPHNPFTNSSATDRFGGEIEYTDDPAPTGPQLVLDRSELSRDTFRTFVWKVNDLCGWEIQAIQLRDSIGLNILAQRQVEPAAEATLNYSTGGNSLESLAIRDQGSYRIPLAANQQQLRVTIEDVSCPR